MISLLRNRWKSVVLITLAAPALAGCSESPAGPDDALPRVDPPRSLTAVESGLLRASNRFGFDLLARLAPAAGADNLFFSPLSASAALGMTLNGAAGNTADQMRSVLGFDGSDLAGIDAAYASLFALLGSVDPRVHVGIANSIWHRSGTTLDPAFVDRVEASFGAWVRGVSFGAPDVAAEINAWVRSATNGMIEQIVDDVEPNLAVLLVNAVGFQAEWTQAFDRTVTAAGEFTLTDGSAVSVPFMSRRMSLSFRHTALFDVIEIPYGGQAYAMTIVLPAAGSDPLALVQGLDDATWNAWTAGLETLETAVELPRFTLTWERGLGDDLRAMGMADAFDPGAADFSAMVPGGGLWLDKVLQKTFVRVDEEGTVAAAATSVDIIDSSAMTVRVDRPFLFAIRERNTGAILFLGVVRDPR